MLSEVMLGQCLRGESGEEFSVSAGTNSEVTADPTVHSSSPQINHGHFQMEFNDNAELMDNRSMMLGYG